MKYQYFCAIYSIFFVHFACDFISLRSKEEVQFLIKVICNIKPLFMNLKRFNESQKIIRSD